jgi:hypothetical protein
MNIVMNVKKDGLLKMEFVKIVQEKQEFVQNVEIEMNVLKRCINWIEAL